jgi:hypothetical protein
MDRGRVGDEVRSKEMDGYPLTLRIIRLPLQDCVN